MDVPCPETPSYLYDMAEKQYIDNSYICFIMFLDKYPMECTIYIEKLIGYILCSIKDTDVQMCNNIINLGCGFDTNICLNGVERNINLSYLSNHKLKLDTIDDITTVPLYINPKKSFPFDKVKEYILNLFI